MEGGDSHVHPQVLRFAGACTLPAGQNNRAILPSRYGTIWQAIYRTRVANVWHFVVPPPPRQISIQDQNPSIVVPIPLSLAILTNSLPTTTSINPNPTLL